MLGKGEEPKGALCLLNPPFMTWSESSGRAWTAG